MDKKLVKHIARLSSFDLSEKQLEQYTQDLTDICEILDVIKNSDTEGIKPMVTPISFECKFRQDTPQDQDNRVTFKKFACEVVDDYFMVPQVVK